ncbi:MAG: cytochrome c biogenesis heme-transporting ATPase CcmA [Burkholderiales bacterium]
MPASVEASAGAGLEVRGMRCERGGRALFDALDFDVPGASALTVVGPNGSGKTTLLRALAGLTETSMRRIAWKHEPIAIRSAAWRSQLAYIGHKPGHKDELSVAENLELACALEGGLATAADRHRVLDEVGLAARGGLPVKRLSQGQKQRLSLARLALSVRALWLLDEPAAALDVDARALLGAILGRHLARRGVAVIATHDPIDLAGACTTQLRLGVRDMRALATAHAQDAAIMAGQVDAC